MNIERNQYSAQSLRKLMSVTACPHVSMLGTHSSYDVLWSRDHFLLLKSGFSIYFAVDTKFQEAKEVNIPSDCHVKPKIV